MRTYSVVIVLLIWASFQSFVTADANEGLSILVKAYQNSGFNPSLIRSGTVEFEITRDRGDSAPSKLFDEMHHKDVEMIKERHQGDEARMALELKRIRDSYEESRRRIVQERAKILMSGNDNTYGGEPGEKYKRRYERFEYVPSLNQWVHSSIDVVFGTLIHSPDIVKSQLGVHWIPNNRELEMKDECVSFGEFQEFGRVRDVAVSSVMLVIRQKIDRKTFALPADFQEFSEIKLQEFGLSVNVVGEIDYDDGAQAKIVEVKKGDELLEKYHIDVDRGYLCPYQFFIVGGNAYERTAMEYIVEKNSGLYYPTIYRSVITKSSGADKTDTQYRLIPGTLRLNHAVSDHEFAIDIPENARVADFRVPDKTVRYVAVNKGVISLAKGGYDLDKMQWLQKEDSLEDYVPPTGGISGWVRWAFVGIGIILILYVIYLKWKKTL